jgi:hypothetical protein
VCFVSQSGVFDKIHATHKKACFAHFLHSFLLGSQKSIEDMDHGRSPSSEASSSSSSYSSSLFSISALSQDAPPSEVVTKQESQETKGVPEHVVKQLLRDIVACGGLRGCKLKVNFAERNQTFTGILLLPNDKASRIWSTAGRKKRSHITSCFASIRCW